MDSPEVAGGFGRIKLGTSYVGTHDVELTRDYLATPPNTSNPVINGGRQLRFEVGMGVANNLDIDLQFPLGLRGKIQVAGAPRSVARQGNTAISLVGGLTFDTNSSSGTSVLNNTSGSYTLSSYLLDVGLVFGYRVADSVLLFGGPNVNYGSYSLDYNVPALTPTTKFSGSLASVAGSVGLEFGTRAFQSRIGGGYVSTSSDRSQAGQWGFGFQIAFQFGKGAAVPTGTTASGQSASALSRKPKLPYDQRVFRHRY